MSSELEYGLHDANVATGELALPRQMSEGIKKNAHTQANRKIYKKNRFLSISNAIQHPFKLA